jgi:multidrug resistance efflux pump
MLLACTGDDEEVLSVAGQIEGVSVDAGSQVGGRVKRVLADEGDSVSLGAVLVELERDQAAAQLAAAEARLAAAGAQLQKARKGPRSEEIEQARAAVERQEEQYRMAQTGARRQEIKAARASVDAALAQERDARQEYERAQRLADEGALPQRQADRARNALDAASAQVDAAREQLSALLEGTRTEELAMARAARDQAAAALSALEAGTREEDVAAAEALQAEAAAAVALARENLEEMTVIAPMDGIVESLDVKPGDLVGPGPLVRMTDPDNLDLKVFVSAYALGFVDLGQEIPLTTDSHGDEEFTGEVVYIASEGEFTPRNLQTEEERVQQMFAVKLKLKPYGGKLKAGMTATAHFDLSGAEKEF